MTLIDLLLYLFGTAFALVLVSLAVGLWRSLRTQDAAPPTHRAG